MPDEDTLPGRLQYLQPFREFLSKLPRAELGDATDTTLLERLIYEQIQGKDVKEAQEILGADLSALQEYLSPPRRRNDRLHFLVGYFLIAAEDPEPLLEPPERPKSVVGRLAMDLPPKTKAQSAAYSLIVKWKRQHFSALVCNMEDAFSRKFHLTKFVHPNASEYERFILMDEPALAERVPPSAREVCQQSVPINLGAVVGHKYVSITTTPHTWKRAGYLLQIPGAYVQVTIDAKFVFDESEWDSYIKTMRFEVPNAQPPLDSTLSA